MGIMTYTFLACTFPLTVFLTYSVIWMPTTSKWAHLSYAAIFFNSLVNPILFLSVSKQARQAFRALIGCKQHIGTSKHIRGGKK